jgi:hypothetical protein
MPVPGDWTLFYDWDCDGSYSKTTMTVNTNGTWTNGEGASGLWVQTAGIFMSLLLDSGVLGSNVV